MEKKFTIAGKRLYARQVVTLIVVVLAYAGIFWHSDIGCERSDDWKMGDSLLMVLMMVALIGLIYWITTMKYHKPGGNLLFNSSEIKLMIGNVTEIIPVAMISGMRLVFKGIEGDVVPGSGLAGMLGLTASSDGSGNMLLFRFNDIDYKINVVLESQEDFNAIGHLFREISEIHGFYPELINNRQD